MARLINPTLGNVKGKIGNLVFRNMYGKTFISSRPVKFTLPTDSLSVNRRKKFALVSSFAKCVNSVPSLKSIWKSAFPDSAPFLNIISHTHKFFSHTGPDENLTLTPEVGFIADKFTQSLSPSGITYSLSLNKNTPFLSEIKSFRIHSILFLTDLVSDCFNETHSLNISSETQRISISKKIPVKTLFTNREKQFISGYQSAFLYSVIILLDKNSNPLTSSQTLFLSCKLSPIDIPSPIVRFTRKLFSSK